MSLPIVAIVGRPNVGKSTFFNKLIGSRLSIVEDSPGVTRDRIYAETDWSGKNLALFDTGGIDPDTEEPIPAQMREQALCAVDMAEVIVFMVDVKEGLTSSDTDVADILRRAKKPIILIANKADGKGIPENLYDFFELGLGEPLPVSAANMTGLGDALDEIIKKLPDESPDEDDERIKIAVIGKPNVGKSSLINALLKEERLIVADTPGTTRDSIDSPIEYDGNSFTLIDTAGLRRQAKINENIEKYSVSRTIAATRRSDVCLVMIDASQGITDQDKKIAGLAHESRKGVVFVINKWDLVEKETGTLEEFRKTINKEMPFLTYAPDVFISVKESQRLNNVLDTAYAVALNRTMRIATGALNSLIQDAMMMKQPPTDKGKAIKIYYAAQVGVKPPLFSFQVNNKDLMHFSYSRYLENRIREEYGFAGTPISFVFRSKEGRR